VELVEIAEGWQILTRPIFAEAIERAAFAARPQKLSGAALEVLSVIAYRQPVGRAEVEEIRGVSCGGVLRLLQERGLIDVAGRSEGLGRPLLYATTPLFLEHLGLRDLADLPRTDELAVALRPAAAPPEPQDGAPETAPPAE
jgi:segregation and condensation protein B